MAIKVKRIHIKNFKPFEDFYEEFYSQNLVVFDGPNGFGKTSFYDAIEILLTGNLRRYNDLVENIVDNRHNVTGSPLLNDRGTGDLSIKGEFDIDGEVVCLKRVGNREELEAIEHIDDLLLELFLLEDFESEESTLIEDEKSYLSKFLGENYTRDFEYLNYIEQEENIYLLKYKEKDRKGAIAHLFNTEDFNNRISHLQVASSKIGQLCNTQAQNSLNEAKQALEDYRIKLVINSSEEEYKHLITWKSVSWDQKQLEFPDEQFEQWLGSEGELEKVEKFILNFGEFKKENENRQLSKLQDNEGLLIEFFLCWNFIDSMEDFKDNLELDKSIVEYLRILEDSLIDAIKNQKLELPVKLQEILKPEINLSEFSDFTEDIYQAQINSDSISQLLIDVKESRDAFIGKFINYENDVGLEEFCPLCGNDWESNDKLKSSFDSQTIKLKNLLNNSGTDINRKLEKLSEKYIDKIKITLMEYRKLHPVDAVFINKLFAASNKKKELIQINQQFETFNIDITPYLNAHPTDNHSINFEDIRLVIDQKKHMIDVEKISPYFGEIFIRIFDSNHEYVSNLSSTDIKNKRRFIEWQHSLNQNKHITELEENYNKQKTLIQDAKSMKNKIDKLKKTYQRSLAEYQKSIIENIEILFHIYSGRIAQEAKGSLGLFIDSGHNGIRFLENHSKVHDAVFTMSSGQLATLVIAFTLALNKRYSKNKVLFIDDPIQTLDELNIAGLVELLRNEFDDRQIFISTHEDSMSAYLRYKFEKYGLGNQRLNFKESQLSN